MRNVTLVPQRNILESRLRIAAHYSRQPADLLAGHRIPFVRHRGRSLLLFAEELFCLAHFGALQVPDFSSDLIQRRSNHRQGPEIVRMAISLNDLRRNCCRLQPQARANLFLDLRRDMGEDSHGAGKLSYTHLFCSRSESRDIPWRLAIPVRQLDAAGDSFGGTAVRPPSL